MRNIPHAAVKLVEDFEEFKPKAYLPLKSDRWTIGYGHTEGVKEGDTCTQGEADVWLLADMCEAQKKIYEFVSEEIINLLTENQWTALLSFVFNAGLKITWKITGRLQHREFDKVPAAMSEFIWSGGHMIRGLRNRRATECALWIKP